MLGQELTLVQPSQIREKFKLVLHLVETANMATQSSVLLWGSYIFGYEISGSYKNWVNCRNKVIKLILPFQILRERSGWRTRNWHTQKCLGQAQVSDKHNLTQTLCSKSEYFFATVVFPLASFSLPCSQAGPGWCSRDSKGFGVYMAPAPPAVVRTLSTTSPRQRPQQSTL